MPATITLEAVRGPLRGRRFVFEEHDTFLFGRAHDCHARLSREDTTASRHHFILEINPPEVRLRDLGSLNGTYINGKKHGGRRKGETPEDAAMRLVPVQIRDRDRIAVGETVFAVKIYVPPFCCSCGMEIPPSFKDKLGWIENTYLCLRCRKERTSAGASFVLHCSECGRDVSEEVPAGRQGDYVCANCREEPDFDPVSILERMLLHQQEEGKEEATLAQVAGYQVSRVVGYGPWGATYLGREEESDRQVAIKIMLAAVIVDEQAREKFIRQIEPVCSLRHPNLAQVVDYGSAGSGFYFVSDYCAGGNVEQLKRRSGGRLSTDEVVAIGDQVLRVLAEAHSNGFVHGDIKPENWLLQSSSGLCVKVADFALTRSFEQSGLSGMTATSGEFPIFAARERFIRFRSCEPESDVWSAAAVLYYLLTGVSPREFGPDRDPLEVLLRGSFVPVRKRRSDVPKSLARIIDRALASDPRERYPSAIEFHKALSRLL